MDNTSELKKKLLDSWDQIKGKYPTVIAPDLVLGDAVKVDFLTCVDGLRTAEEIQQFFTLSSSEAHLIFTDLLNLGVIRFLEDGERLAYLKNHVLELEKNMGFLRSERESLRGESLYLGKQVQDKLNETEAFKIKLPELTEAHLQLTENLSSLKANSETLWDQNAELFGVAKDIKHKATAIKTGLAKLETDLPKVMKKRTKVVDRFERSEEIRHSSADKNKVIEKRLFDYHDALSDVREYLEDTKLRVKGFSEKD